MHSKKADASLEALKNKLGEDSKIYNTAQKVAGVFKDKPSLKAQQQELLSVIRSSNGGDVIEILREVAKANPKINEKLRNMLHLTTSNLTRELQKFEINPQDIKIIFDDYTKGTKAAYEEANEKILSKIYDDNYKVVLDSKEFDKFYEETLNNYELPSSFKNTLLSIKHKVYNPQGVTYKDLEATRKSLNNLFSEDKTLDSYLKNFISSHLREDINKGINNIFSQNKEAYKQARTLYETKLADYAQLKEIQDSTIYKKIQNVDNSLEDIAKAILENAKGAGKVKETGMIDKTLLNNFNELTKGLTEQNRQSLELNLLHKIFQSSLIADNHIKVFNSELFLDNLAQNKEIFKSTGAKEYIQVIKDFNTLFKRDADILSNLPNANPKENNTNIATNISGPFKHMGVSGLFGIIYRNLPHDGLFFGMLFPTMGQGIQKAALKYHLGKALKESSSLENFNFNITQRANRGGFNSPTKELVERIVEQVSEVKEEALRVAKEGDRSQSLTRLTQQELSDEVLQQAQQNNTKLWIGDLRDKQLGESLGMDINNPIKITMRGDSITHILKRHGIDSINAKNGQPPISYQDLREHQEIINNADARVIQQKNNQNILISGKQVNGYYVVVETISTKNNELKLKTMYKENGDLRNNPIFTKTLQDQQSGGESLSINPSNPLDKASGFSEPIIPQSIDKANRFAEPFSNELFNALPKEIQAQYQSLQKQAREFNLKFQQAKDFDTKMAYRKQYNDILDEIYNFEQIYPVRTPQSPTNLLDKALKEKQESIAKEQQLQQQAQQEEAKRASLLKAQRQSIQQAKDSNVGKSVNEVELALSDSIPYTPLRQTSINLENKTYNAKYVIIKKQDLKPNFTNTGTQGRLIKQTRVIEDIQNNLNPNKLFFSEGSFDGLPVILQDGSVSVGNHRAQALKNLSKESLQTYKEVAKKAFNVDLRDDEVIVRMLDFDIPKQEVLNLSFASNVGREQNIAEKALSTLGKYQEGISKLPKTITASSVEEMQSIISKTLDNTNNGLNTFDTNLALFTYLAKTRNKSILESLESLKGSAEEKQATLRMFVENAGNFYNISQQTLMPKLDLRDYLAQALYFTIKASPSRRDNFREVITQIQDLLKTTNTQGKNAFIEQNPYYYEDLIGKILGYSLARFKELENPAKNLFEFLSNLETALREELEPTLFSGGRAISTADIYDFLSMNIKSGIPSKETSELLELLPKLKERQEGFKGSLEGEDKNSLLSNANLRNNQQIGEYPLEGEVLEKTPLTYHTEQSKSIAELRTSLKEALSPYVNKDIVNIATNIKAQISSTGINKIASKKAVDKSINNGFSRDEHFKAGENINKLFENATLKSTKADKNQSPHLRAIYRFDSPLLINNKEANALITLKESIENGKKIYSLELEELSPSSNTQRHTNKEQQGQLMLTKVADTQGETLTTPIAKTDTQIIPQSQTLQGLESAFENNKESAKNLHSSTLTKGETLPLNSDTIIPKTKDSLEKSLNKEEILKEYEDTFLKQLNIWDRDLNQEFEDLIGLINKTFQPFYLTKQQWHNNATKDIWSIREISKALRLELSLDELEPSKTNLTKALKLGKIDANKIFKSFDKNSAEIFVNTNGKGFSSEKLKKEVIKLIQKAAQKEQDLIKGFVDKLNTNTKLHSNPQSPTNVLDKSLKQKQQQSIKDQELTTGINPIDNLQTATLKEEFATANTSQKISIIERELLKENEALTKEYNELNEIIKNKDYTSFEISEATNFIKSNTKSLGEKYIELVNPFDAKKIILIPRGTPKEQAEHFLEWKIRNESLIPISKTIDNNKKQILKLKSDLEFSWSESNKARLEKNLARLEKHLLKQEEEYFKSLSLTYDLNTQEGLEKTKDLFYRANPTQEQIQLFESILPIAKKLGVEVRNAIREPYQRGGNTKHISGIYLLNQNSARVKHSVKEKEKSTTLLHELIHSVTSRAMIAYERGSTHILNKQQIQAIENINSLYQQVFKQSDELGLSLQNDYGLTNPHELLAELSNPSFVEKLKKINVFEKLIDNIIKLFVSIKEIVGLKKANAYDTLKNNVADIIQNYKSDFTQQYNDLKIRNITLNKDTIPTKSFAYHTQTPKGIASLRASLKEALSPYINKEIINKETGLSGTISVKEINKISSSKAVDKSIYNGFSRDEHFKVSENLKELFENAHLNQTHTDYKERPNIQAVHRFNTPLSINQKEAVAKITLFEKRLGSNKVYSLELESLSPAPLSKDADNTGAAVKAQLVESPHNKSTTIAKTDEAIIPQIQNKFKYDKAKAKDLLEWHKESHPITKDEQGLPKVFYHGSRNDKMFEVFDTDKEIRNMGIWLTPKKEIALKYAKDLENTPNQNKLFTAFIKAKNPFDMSKIQLNSINDIKKWANFFNIKLKGDMYESGEQKVLNNIEWEQEAIEQLRNGEIDEAEFGFGNFIRNELEVLLHIGQIGENQGGKLKEFLQSKGYDAIKFNDFQFVVFNPNQIKALQNKGSIPKSKGEFKTASAKDTTKEGFQYFNEQSPNIYHSNPHLGSGLVGGSVAGFESDEQGNLSFNPTNFLLGLGAGVAGSKGVAQGFKAIKDNPEFKEKLTKELASTLSKGWESAIKQYPILQSLEPRYIVKNEKGREVQAKGVLKELENKEAKGLYNVAYNGKNATRVFKDLEVVEKAIRFSQGNKNKGAKHIKIKHLTDQTQEGYVTPLEIANLGKDLRAFLKNYEFGPYVEKNGANIYEWENDAEVRFRLVVNEVKGEADSNPAQLPKPFNEEIITFYSDRNLEKPMEFKNYWVRDYVNKKHAREIIDAIEPSTYEPPLPYSQEQIDLALQKYHRAVESEKQQLKKLPFLSRTEAKNLLKEDEALYEKYKTYHNGKEYGLYLMARKLREDRNANAQAHNAKIEAEYTKIEQKYSHLYDEYLAMLKENQPILEQSNIQQEKKEIALALQRYDVLTNITSMLEKGYTKKEINYLINKAINKPSELAYNILRNYDTPPIGRGYNGYSMSNNAIAAYANGIKPISKWNAQDAKEFGEIIGVKVKLKELKEFLLAYGEKGYHHTSSYYNETKFYSLAEAMQYKENLVRYFPYAILE